MNNKNPKTKTQLDIEWENRKLCSDEGCIGVIGPDGRCKECGLPYGSEPSTAEAEPPFDEDGEYQAGEAFDEDTGNNTPMNKTELDIEWKNRRLCSDESCIGVIGPDGRCKECGKVYEGK